MRVLYFSDIHIEFIVHGTRLVDEWTRAAPFPLSCGPDLRPFKGKVDVVVLAGDIGCFTDDTIGRGPTRYATQLADFMGVPVIFVAGNHEFYNCNDINHYLDRIRNPSLTVENNNVFILENKAITIAGVRFIGATLWTDYRVMGWEYEEDCMRAAERYMPDHRGAIRKIGANGGKKNFTAKDARQLCKDSVTFIQNELKRNPVTATVIVTHHIPITFSETINPHFPTVDETTAGFMSHMPSLVELASSRGTQAWIFGHHHWSLQSEAYGVKLLSAQRGYQQENSNWAGPQILEI